MTGGGFFVYSALEKHSIVFALNRALLRWHPKVFLLVGCYALLDGWAKVLLAQCYRLSIAQPLVRVR
jgi:hypothetical protein